MSASKYQRADGRKAWTTHITDDAKEQLRAYADSQGVSVGLLVEALAAVLDPGQDPFDPTPIDMKDVIVTARRLGAEGRARMGNREAPFGRQQPAA